MYTFDSLRSLSMTGLRIIVLLCIQLQAIGPKHFVKEDWFWCRKRESHPGRQCCVSAGRTPLEIPMLAEINSNVDEIDGYGTDCYTTCDCTTILPEVKCSNDNECKAKVGPYFKCIKDPKGKGTCKYPCTFDSDCDAKFGYGSTADKGLYAKGTYVCAPLKGYNVVSNHKFCKVRDDIAQDKK